MHSVHLILSFSYAHSMQFRTLRAVVCFISLAVRRKHAAATPRNIPFQTSVTIVAGCYDCSERGCFAGGSRSSRMTGWKLG